MAKGKTRKSPKKIALAAMPVFAEEALASVSDSTTRRRNRAATITRTDKFTNIDDAFIPFSHEGNYYDISKAISLCRKAYFNFPLLRNTIDVMTELSNSTVYLKGGTKKARDFFNAWFTQIRMWSIKEKFFREFFRSGNVFFYRFDGRYSEGDIAKMRQAFGGVSSLIPIRYIILNPEDIRSGVNSTFTNAQYLKVLNGYEIELLRNPKTKEDKALFSQLTADQKQAVLKGIAPMMPLDLSRLYAVFYKKQDYEPFAVPMAYPVLDDINWKMELKKVDQAVARMVDRVILLITTGARPEEGGVNPNTISRLQQLFGNESVNRVLIADYTTKGEWLIPDINKVLGPEKYQIVNEDIRQGLNIILVGDEKFANSLMKTQVFLERLKEARRAFLEEFLMPEIRRISEEMNFQSYPEAIFEEIDLKDELQFAKVYTRLMELGILTPDEGLTALETGELPNAEDSLAAQQEYKKQRDKGLYAPLVGGSNLQSQTAGRPGGAGGSPQATKKVGPIGKSKASFGARALYENLNAVLNLKEEVGRQLCKAHKLKTLNEQQRAVASDFTTLIATSAPRSEWMKVVRATIEEPRNIPKETVEELAALEEEFGVDADSALALKLSRV